MPDVNRSLLLRNIWSHFLDHNWSYLNDAWPLLTELESSRLDLSFNQLERMTSKRGEWLKPKLVLIVAKQLDRPEVLQRLAQDESIPEQVSKLSVSTEPSERMKAALVLASSSTGDAAQPLALALREDRDELVRSCAALGLGRIASDEAIKHLAYSVEHESDSVVRFAIALGFWLSTRKDVFPYLLKLLDKNERVYVRAAAVRCLGRIDHPNAVEPLRLVLMESDSESVELRVAAADALVRTGTLDAVRALGTALIHDKDTEVRKSIAEALGALGHADGIRPLGEALAGDMDPSVRTTAVIALGKIRHPECLDPLKLALGRQDEDVSIRIEAARSLGEIEVADAMRPLVDNLLQNKDPGLREVVLQTLYRSAMLDWVGKTELVVAVLKESKLYREGIEGQILLQVISPPPEQLEVNRHILTDYLIELAIGQDDRLTGIFAQLIVDSTGRSLRTAGERVNEFERSHTLPADALQKLRIEIGGETALDPIIKELRANLQKNFQEPIRQLNGDTHRMWQATIRDARYGFAARMILSGVVFVVGIVILVVSFSRIISNELRPEQLLGPGVSFVSGLAMMLLIIYTGPLKEIRQSVADLGIASAAFIAYVHRVLEVSHTFSFYYLKENMTFDEMQKSSDLIGIAMRETVRALQTGDKRTAENVIRDTVTTYSRPVASAEDTGPTNSTLAT